MPQPTLSIEWDPPLRYRKGGGSRLRGLDVFYDFRWTDVFGHDRAMFPYGKSLADLVVEECPDNRVPTLLLTERDAAQPGILNVDGRHVVVVPITSYLEGAGGDPASTFYARASGQPLTQLPTLAEAAFTEAELGRFLQANLTRDRLAEWADASGENRTILADVADGSAGDAIDLALFADRLASLTPEQWEPLAEHLGEVADRGINQAITNAVADSASGRSAVAEVLGSRLRERIADVREQLSAYNELIADEAVTETDVQQFLERAPWIVGLAYVRARPRVEIPRGEVDFVLDRYDGYFDIVELKGPGDPIVAQGDHDGDRPPSASSFSLGPSVAKALAQAHLYKANLASGDDLAPQYGLLDPGQPRVIVLVGRSGGLTDTGREILRQLNLSLHRVEVLPYDVLGERTEGWLQNIEQLLDD